MIYIRIAILVAIAVIIGGLFALYRVEAAKADAALKAQATLSEQNKTLLTLNAGQSKTIDTLTQQRLLDDAATNALLSKLDIIQKNTEDTVQQLEQTYATDPNAKSWADTALPASIGKLLAK